MLKLGICCGSGIWDGKNSNPGSGLENIRIRNIVISDEKKVA